MMPIQLKNVHVTIEQKSILENIDLTVNKGEFIGLIGPNGSGKSTLLKSILTLLPIQNGDIFINGKQIHALTQKDLAKQISYVPQETVVSFDFPSKEIVAMGRHPYHTFFKSESDEDKMMVERAMNQTNTLHLADKSILSLSSGQRQLIMIAKGIAQDTPIILLDEPISALDIYYQLHILSLLKNLSENGKTMIIVLHDLNLAARFCDKLLLLKDGRIQQYGLPEEVLTESLLKSVYHIQPNIRKDNLIRALMITPTLSGEKNS